MATFLELTQMTARESGTVSGPLPISVEGQDGRLAKFVHWTRTAWTHIQNDRATWLWMQDDFEGTTTAGSARYTGASFSLPRLAEWIVDGVTIYRESDGRADEGDIAFIGWPEYRRLYDRGEPQQNRPVHFSISPVGEMCFGPVPDDTYVVRGGYRKTPQILMANGDIPEMPARFHDLIAWNALLLMAEHDEASLHIAVALRRSQQLDDDLRRDQLPMITSRGGGPLA